MIPIRVTMSGWMRYREPATADFAGARLLSICGENGSGKSSIFDAITFALFGRQRLGLQHIDELISDGGDQCFVELEFEQEGKRYRVRRTRGRRATQGSQGLWIWDPMAEDWLIVPNTQYARGLDKALAALLRITPEAFTSSFLLQQGAATDFLDAKPAERFGVVSSLVNLEEYQALEKKAREAQRAAAAMVQQISTKLQEFDGVDAESLAILRTRLDQSAEQRQAAERDRDLARRRHEAAREYARIKREIDTTMRQMESAEELLSEARQIEEDARRFEALGGELQTVRQVQEELTAASLEEAKATTARDRLAVIDIETLASASAAAAHRLETAVVAVERLAHEHQTAVADRQEAAEFLRLAEQIATLRDRLHAAETEREAANRELARLPEREAEAAHLRAVAAALPYVQAFGNARRTVERLGKDDPHSAATKLDVDIEDLTLRQEMAAQEVNATTLLLEESQDAAARTRAEARTLREQVERRREAVDEAVCSRCGQRIDPEQAKQELHALESRTESVERWALEAERAVAQARTANTDAIRRRDAVREELRQATSDRQSLWQRLQDLDDAADAAREAYQQFVEVAPEELRRLIPEDLPLPRLHEIYRGQQALAGRATEVEAELRRLHALEGAARSAEQLIAQIRSDLAVAEQRAGERLDHVAEAGRLHDAAERRLHDAQAALDSARQEERDASEADRAAADALRRAEEDSRELERTIATLTQTADAQRRTAARIADRLDSALRDRALTDPRAALDLLEREQQRLAGAPARLANLAEARQLHSRLGGMLAKLMEDRDRIPEEQRIDEDTAQFALAQAEDVLRQTAQAWESCQREVSRMERDLEQVEVLRADLARAETRSHRLRRLVEILGKNGLQGTLVSEALDTVMSHANSFLERLTGGTLVLRLERGDGDALELKAQDVTCMREARSVQVLSGSQKFRCAVAIAAGIGQYAGAGGMRSIVIDEGFGSLDQQGQLLIIEELKNLAAHMDRVIVVSHIEAFSDRIHFPDQIHVIRDGDRSRIARIQ